MSYELTLTNNFWTCVHTLLFGTGYFNPVGTIYSYCNGFSGGGYPSAGGSIGDARQLTTIGSFIDTNNVERTQVAGEAYLSGDTYREAYNLSLIAFPNKNAGYGTIFSVGSGTTEPTINDIVVESPISDVTISVTAQNSSNGSVTYHLTVTATATITISEICMLKNLETTCKNGTAYTVLIGRLVLPEEDRVTLASGDNKTFDITISLPKPTA